MQRPTRNLKATKPKELTPEQLRQQEAEAIAYQARIDVYLAAQRPAVIGQNPFDSLPSEVVGKIATEHLPRSDVRRFAKTYPSLFSRERLMPVKARAETEVQQFLLHVLNANLTAAKEMLKIDPGLILEEHSVGEHQSVTGLLLAKRMGDIGMCEMLLEHSRAYDVECSERFNCKVDRTSAQIANVAANSLKKAPYDVKNFDLVADAIAIAKPSDVEAELIRHRIPEHQMTDLSTAMDTYRSTIDQHGECTAEDMANVFDALVRNAEKFKTCEQCALFFLQVAGYLARKLPLCLRMALSQGISDMLQNNDVVNLGARSTTHVTNNDSYSLVDFDLLSWRPVLGFDFAFDNFGLSRGSDAFRGMLDGLMLCREIQKFCRASESALVELMQPRSESGSQPEEVKQSWCVIC